MHERAQHQAPVLHVRLDRQVQRLDGRHKTPAALVHPQIAPVVGARFARRHDLSRVEAHTDERVRVAESQPEH
ncbi:MAG: hypothetical protein A3K11_12160 [Nitrospirae bacterium RIFCSPLOWO2_12_FULL_63_8]|nr:MAG: hypothetical protein A3K11_12160 [Nitrospirae bacterium RIFCSPLOWO2_12_FULL_63_8]